MNFRSICQFLTLNKQYFNRFILTLTINFIIKMIIKKLLRNILNRLFIRKFDDIKIQKGQIFEKSLISDIKNIRNLNQTYFKVCLI